MATVRIIGQLGGIPMPWTGSVRALVAALSVAALSVAVAGGSPVGAQTGSGGRPGVTSTTIKRRRHRRHHEPGRSAVRVGLRWPAGVLQLHQRQGRRLRPQVPARARSSTTSRRASQDVDEARSLVEEAKVFAVAPVVTQIFAGASYLAGKGVPTFGWNIDAGWQTGYPAPGFVQPHRGQRGAQPVRGEGLLPLLHLHNGGAGLHRPADRRQDRRHPRLLRAAVGAVRGRAGRPGSRSTASTWRSWTAASRSGSPTSAPTSTR